MIKNSQAVHIVKELAKKNDKINYVDMGLPTKVEDKKITLFNLIISNKEHTEYQVVKGNTIKAVKYLLGDFKKRSAHISCKSDRDFTKFRLKQVAHLHQSAKASKADKFLLSYSKSTRSKIDKDNPDIVHKWLDHRIKISPILAGMTLTRAEMGEFYQAANTLTTGEGCGSWSSVNLIFDKTHKGLIRYLTPEEAEKLQGWDGYLTATGVRPNGKKYQIPESTRYRMVGNGVPPIFSSTILDHLHKGKGNYTVMSGFSGIGGMERMLDRRKYTLIGNIENDSKCDDVLRHNYNNKIINYGDFTKLDFNALPDFDVSLNGLVCKAWSSLGKSLGFDDPRGKLFFHLLKMLEVKKPKTVLIENVKGLITRHKKAFLFMCEKLSELGYTIDFELLNAVDFGLPQNRERVILVGILK